MDNVSQCIATMLERQSDGLLLMDGKPPVMRLEGKAQAFSATPITEAELTAFLAETLALSATDLASESPKTFAFHGASAPVLVKKIRKDGVLSLQIAPAPAGTAAPVPVSTPEIPASVAAEVRADASPATGRLVKYFATMISEGASDLHLSTGAPPYLRKDGEMIPLAEAPFTNDELHAVLMEIIPDRNRIEYDQEFDTDFAFELSGKARFRCNYFNDRNGCAAVFRQIPVDILTTTQLGLPEQLLNLCHLTKGLVLVTGPTGSGKSTTLAALIDHINKTRNDHIITIEDPIEFVHQNRKCLVNQREVKVHTKGFKQALRAALREDPDIVLVGELRDLETISIAVETAETGHLVFGTLHTTTAVSTIDRIIDQYPADQQGQIRVMLSESMRGVISQTLCKKKGGGRVAALEVLLYTRAIGNLIREGKTFQIPSAMQTGKKEGMMLLNDALANLVNQNLITADEAFVRSVDKDGIQPLLADKGLTIGV
ncbi:MAG: type IV pilus twitching motility protein PilT [Candidatus Krumholzibacteria bacterium]|nr:type IV pilus twitching motility protein PilT [Candidatus Krumholzibacteria bacterium]